MPIPRVFPGSTGSSNLAVLRTYQRSWLRGDVLAGVTVAAYLVPQVMAYASVAGLPPVAGLWAMLPCLLIYSVLGSSRQLSVGPESTTAVLTASIIAPLAAGDAGRYAGLAAELSLVFGVFCLAAWLLRLGFVAEMLSRPVLVGYISGVAVIMAVGQLDKVTGIPVKGSNLWSQARSLFGHLSEFRPAAAGVAAGTIALLLLLHRYWPGGPGALIAVVVMTVLVAATGLDRHGVVLTGTFTGGLLRPHLPPIGNLDQLLLPAVGILIVGYTDNILTARSFASRAGYEVNANQELLALGACNVGSAVVGGFPVSSSASRTALGAAAGSRTQLYSLTALAAVLGTLVFLRPALAHFPRAALGGLVIYAAVRLVDLAEFRRLARFRRQELLLALAATAGVLTFDIWHRARPRARQAGPARGSGCLRAGGLDRGRPAVPHPACSPRRLRALAAWSLLLLIGRVRRPAVPRQDVRI